MWPAKAKSGKCHMLRYLYTGTKIQLGVTLYNLSHPNYECLIRYFHISLVTFSLVLLHLSVTIDYTHLKSGPIKRECLVQWLANLPFTFVVARSISGSVYMINTLSPKQMERFSCLIKIEEPTNASV